MSEQKPKSIVDSIATKIVIGNSIAENKSDLGVSQQFNRRKYDNVYKRYEYKKSVFSDGKTIEDHYTGDMLHIKEVAARNKYGSDNYTKHTSDVDHIVPVKTVYEDLKGNPFLTDSEVKEIANLEQNYRITSSKYNRGKGSNNNIKVAIDVKSEFDVQARLKIVEDHVKAKTTLNVVVTAKTVRNIGKDFSQGAKSSLEASAIPLVIMGTQNLILVAKGEKQLDVAVIETGKALAGNAISGGAIKVTTTALTNAFKNSSTELLQKIAESNCVSQIITVSLIIKDSVVSYINGEITGEQFMEQIGEKGVALISGSMGAIIGQALIPIPYVGAFIGSMIASTVCVEIYKFAINMKEAYKSFNEYDELKKKIDVLADSALKEMEMQRNHLKATIGQEFGKWDSEFNSAFDLMIHSALNDDVNGIAGSFDKILNVFGENVCFKTYEEFDTFFMDENSILKM